MNQKADSEKQNRLFMILPLACLRTQSVLFSLFFSWQSGPEDQRHIHISLREHFQLAFLVLSEGFCFVMFKWQIMRIQAAWRLPLCCFLSPLSSLQRPLLSKPAVCWVIPMPWWQAWDGLSVTSGRAKRSQILRAGLEALKASHSRVFYHHFHVHPLTQMLFLLFMFSYVNTQNNAFHTSFKPTSGCQCLRLVCTDFYETCIFFLLVLFYLCH